MDSLFHLVVSLAGGFIFLELAKIKYHPLHLFALAALSLSIDIQHLFEAFYIYPVFHAVYFASAPLLVALFFYSRKQSSLFSYSVLLSVMFMGHLFFDMIQGMYGAPLFHPLSEKLFMLPWALMTFNGTPVIGAAGLAMFLFFSLILIASMAVRSLRQRE